MVCSSGGSIWFPKLLNGCTSLLLSSSGNTVSFQVICGAISAVFSTVGREERKKIGAAFIAHCFVAFFFLCCIFSHCSVPLRWA